MRSRPVSADVKATRRTVRLGEADATCFQHAGSKKKVRNGEFREGRDRNVSPRFVWWSLKLCSDSAGRYWGR